MAFWRYSVWVKTKQSQRQNAIKPQRQKNMTSKSIPFLLLCCLLIWSCSNEIELNAPSKEIAVVYGILSPKDEVHYIRIEKAFLEENTSAIELAQRPDQLYFDNLEVELVQDSDGQRFKLVEVDGTLEGVEREAGVFATTPNILYKIATNQLSLQEEESYTLNIRKADTDEVIATAQTTIVGSVRLNRPIPGANKLPLRIEEDETFTVLWAADESAQFFDVKMDIHFEEIPANGTPSSKTLTWTIAKNVDAIEGPNKIEVEGIEFYKFLASILTEEVSLTRRINTIDIRVDAGGKELFNYINVGQANTGITSSQVIPTYTNIENGLGIFASRNQLIEEGFFIDSITRELLKNGELTRRLNFE